MVRRFPLALCGGAMMLAAAVVAAGERSILEGILVRVNDRVMTVSDFRERLDVELSQVPMQSVDADLERFARGIFDSVVDEMIILERAKEKRLTVDDDTLDRAIQDLREENELQDDAAFQAALEGAGLTESLLRDRYRQSILLQRTVQSEVRQAEVTEEEARQVYEVDKEQYRVPKKIELEQIFFPVASDGSDRNLVLRSVRALVERVRDGNDLRAEATLAGVEVQELGAIPEEDLRQELIDRLDGLVANDITDAIETSGGIQLLRLVRRIPAGYQPFEEVSDTIRRKLVQDSFQDQSRGMVDRLKAEYLVDIHEDRLEKLIEELGDG